MSEDFDIVCVDCDANMGVSDANRADGVLWDAIEKRDAFAVLADLAKYDMRIELLSGAGFDCEFFKVHVGHQLAVESEYSRREHQGVLYGGRKIKDSTGAWVALPAKNNKQER